MMSRRNTLRVVFALCAITIPFAETRSTLAAEPVRRSIEERWEEADDAYRTGETARGHALLRKLTEDHPGDYDLAVRCLSRILGASSRHIPENPWPEYASSRLRALERLGVISANSWSAHRALQVQAEADVRHGRLFQVIDDVDRLARENPHDLEWQIGRALWHRQLDSPETAPIYANLRRRMDLNHPDDTTRALWAENQKELEVDSKSLPNVVVPVPKGSPLHLMEPDDPDGRWREFLDRRFSEIVDLADRLAGLALADDQTVFWLDKTGLTDPARVVDMHLQGQRSADLDQLRKLQEDHFSLETLPPHMTDGDAHAHGRRYARSKGAQEQLLGGAHRALWAGRAHAALRSFEEILAHANDPELRERAQVGVWVSQSMIGDAAELQRSFESVDATATFPWMGNRLTAQEIAKSLPVGEKSAGEVKSAEGPALEGLAMHVLRIPAISPWPASSPSSTLSLDMQTVGDKLLVSGRNLISLYDAKDPKAPLWTSAQRDFAQEKNNRRYYPGYFRPTFHGDSIFARSSFTATPRGISSLDPTTGQPRWSNEAGFEQKARRRRSGVSVPLSEPVVADGLLFYLEWQAQGDVGQQRGRRLGLVAYDPGRRQEVWNAKIASAGDVSDMPATLERAQPDWAIYGNRVTVHGGAVYSSSNTGIIARSDVRDGRVDWLHFYRQGQHKPTRRGLGCSPIVSGDRVLCMPRDTGRAFALDARTGRLVWDNPLVLARESLGLFEDQWIVVGESAIVGLDLASGRLRWHRPLKTRSLGRAHLRGSSVYIAHVDAVERIDALTGRRLEVREWGIEGERPQTFTVSGDALFVVTDRPADEHERKEVVPINPDGPAETPELNLPLVRAWEIARSHARVATPPVDTPENSPLHRKAFVLSGGLLECIEVSARGGILWRRFVHLLNPSIHFHGENVVLYEHERQPARVASNRILALRGGDGGVVWDRSVPIQIQSSIRHGSIEMFRDQHGNVAAVDLTSGSVLWERHFGPGEVQWSKAGDELHVALRAAHRSALHVSVDIATGQSVDEYVLEIAGGKGANNNGIPLDNGYYEVRFPARKARYFRLQMLSEINGRGWSSIAELQVAAKGGQNISRDPWQVAYVDSTETKARYDTRPETVFDGDPTSWWHTQWINGIPPHPHEMVIDTGLEQEIEALRYLPAVIINNNGMIKHYALYTSLDGKTWGDPVAQGIMVGRLQIQSPRFAEGGLFFQVQHHQTKQQEVFRYDLDSQPAKRVTKHGRIVETHGKYAILADHEGRDHEALVVLRTDDPSYRFELGRANDFHGGQAIRVEGSRLYLGKHNVVIADLEKKEFVAEMPKGDSKRKKQGMIVRDGQDRFIKIVHEGNKGQVVTMFDAKSREFTECVLDDQLDQFQDCRHSTQQREVIQYDGVLLLYDGSTVSAWVGGDGVQASG